MSLGIASAPSLPVGLNKLGSLPSSHRVAEACFSGPSRFRGIVVWLVGGMTDLERRVFMLHRYPPEFRSQGAEPGRSWQVRGVSFGGSWCVGSDD